MNFPPTLVKPTSTYFNAIYGMIHSSLILYTACIDIYDAILIFILEWATVVSNAEWIDAFDLKALIIAAIPVATCL